ncbi:hypothetical protein B1812_11295 [Methylocystis bryophila]|uniref:Outer membrane protein beta-barrel domain-containing protein n=1 Tax=Methylocystis bryophila TaxID=655015 RepID=A0A1W6N1A6_9HYPH|nr:hypothetical protein B1812_11295 [Methylocystis bryophila]
MKSFLSATALSLALTASAFAADLPSYKAPLVAPPPPFTWTGLYGGINIGYGVGNGDQDSGYAVTLFPASFGIPGWTISNDLNGVVGGGQVGYNYQFNPWLVVGLEADLQASDVHSQGTGVGIGTLGTGSAFIPQLNPATSNFVFASQNKSVDWFGTVRARVGVTLPSFPSLLVYGTGGLAYGGVVHSVNASDFFPSARTAFPVVRFGAGAIYGSGGNYDSTRVGWTAGGGVEWSPFTTSPLLKTFSVKLEYLYTDLGSTTIYGSAIGATPGFLPFRPLTAPLSNAGFAYRQASATRFQTVRVGVNWHFNPFAADPVLAKY